MAVPEDTSFARLVSLACHDLRTPLATAHGFARTLMRVGGLDPPRDRYVEIISQASAQLAELVDLLSLAARIQAGRYEPEPRAVDSAELARAASERVNRERIITGGEGAAVTVEPEATEIALAGLANCALRHGGLERVELSVAGAEIAIEPVTPSVAPIILGEDLRDLGAAVGVRIVAALGGSVELDGERLRVRLPTEAPSP
jgi:signal transduction histidine kinase